MQQKSQLAILFLSLILLPIILSDARKNTLLGGWKPIENIKDPHVIEIAEFAVNEYNKVSKIRLEFNYVIKGETQVVFGINYRLVMMATDGPVASKYEAVVLEGTGPSSMNLTSFKLLVKA